MCARPFLCHLRTFYVSPRRQRLRYCAFCMSHRRRLRMPHASTPCNTTFQTFCASTIPCRHYRICSKSALISSHPPTPGLQHFLNPCTYPILRSLRNLALSSCLFLCIAPLRLPCAGHLTTGDFCFVFCSVSRISESTSQISLSLSYLRINVNSASYYVMRFERAWLCDFCKKSSMSHRCLDESLS